MCVGVKSFLLHGIRQRFPGEADVVAKLHRSQWIDDLKKPEPVKITVAGHDPGNAVLAHQRCCVPIVHQIAARLRQFIQTLTQNRRMPAGRSEDTLSRTGEQWTNGATGQRNQVVYRA